MKKFFSMFLLISALISFSCSDNATGPGGDGGLGGGGGGGGSVTFTVGTKAGTQGANYTIFTFKPSVNVIITSLTLKLPAQPFEDPYTDNTGTVYNAQTVYDINTGQNEYTNVQPGQQWQVVFVGKIGSTTGADYNVTTNYTIP